jgi:DnaK suppressor protein
MDEDVLASFRKLLETRLNELLDGGCAPILKLADSGQKDPMDPVDMASHHCNQELIHTIHNRNQQLVTEIQFAIQRIDDGEFGTCCLCSASIGLERLQARPTAMLCIRCQGTLETLRRRLAAA